MYLSQYMAGRSFSMKRLKLRQNFGHLVNCKHYLSMFEYIPAHFAANLLTVMIVFCYERWGGWLRNCIGKILQTGIFKKI